MYICQVFFKKGLTFSFSYAILSLGKRMPAEVIRKCRTSFDREQWIVLSPFPFFVSQTLNKRFILFMYPILDICGFKIIYHVYLPYWAHITILRISRIYVMLQFDIFDSFRSRGMRKTKESIISSATLGYVGRMSFSRFRLLMPLKFMSAIPFSYHFFQSFSSLRLFDAFFFFLRGQHLFIVSIIMLPIGRDHASMN